MIRVALDASVLLMVRNRENYLILGYVCNQSTLNGIETVLIAEPYIRGAFKF